MTTETRRSRSVLLRAALAALSRIAHAIGNFQARVILTIVYYVVLGPFALIARRQRDRGVSTTFWHERNDTALTVETARRQF